MVILVDFGRNFDVQGTLTKAKSHYSTSKNYIYVTPNEKVTVFVIICVVAFTEEGGVFISKSIH